ncbi:MAG: hypothetical protein ACE364_08065 [Chlorobiota bacterium]
MFLNDKKIKPALIKFFFKNIYNKELFEWESEIQEFNEAQLKTLKKEFENYLFRLPRISELHLYSSYKGYLLEGNKHEIDITGGDQTIIKTSYDYGNELIQFINSRLNDIQELRIKEFPKFGEWDNLENPKRFVLRIGILPCVVLSFNKVSRLEGQTYEDIYSNLSTILSKRDGTLYSERTIKNSRIEKDKKKTLKECNKIVSFSINESVEFVRYLLEQQKTL